MVNNIIPKIVSIIFLSSFMGCLTINEYTCYLPQKPKLIKIEFTQTNNGYLITENDAKILADNIDEMKAYEKKLELLVKEIAKSYNVKLEEYKIE